VPGLTAPALHLDHVVLDLPVAGFDDALETIARALTSDAGIALRPTLLALHERERAHSTAWGSGIAVPHARIIGLPRSYVALARLASPIECGASDKCPVDLLLLVLSPESEPAEHVRLLGRLARRLRDAEVVRRVRAAANESELRAAIESE
jgi:PTS system nitrogen regulatory IIA component